MATTHRTVVIGVFEDRSRAQQAVDELRRLGFAEDQIGVAYRAADSNGEIDPDFRSTLPHESYADEGAVAGGIAGAGIGGLWAIGIAAGVLPAIGPAIAGGVLASLLASTAVGAVTGGVVGALLGLGVPEDEAHYYEGEFRSGRTLVTVKADDRYDEAHEVLAEYGAYDIDTAEQETAHEEPVQLTDTRNPADLRKQDDFPLPRHEIVIERVIIAEPLPETRATSENQPNSNMPRQD
jgi:hypothetical protein